MMLEATGNLNSPDSRGAQWAWSAVELSRPPSSPANAEMYVTLTVLSASNLPKMDVLRKCDGYCMVYVDGNTLQPTYRTETVVGSLNPEWNSSFEWQLYPGMTILTVAVWDRDNLTADDLIGTAFVDLSDLSSSEVEMKLDLKNPLLRKKLTACKSSVLVKVGLRSSSVHDIASRPMADSSIRM
ncbi:hypothetical protein GUITHDRAFT_106497 [Guillardia theta CCMP2712]|uniref:C2 domain-containing protein n=1 Tax=Guillardia theta (strain CCMP2712) TaxID=905079 RepID=L1JHD7_GUITC|nr:hypothetical protein GUITHDRAFT_106497 [Guillardia theta CCMP2712]EKX47510.1 hypothetical protein GUITHDRAFT_106497 [Guillardia theta CCMP2712]|mmetsp:Transcript_6959/g.24372  ORF Transcript_6959/g.24372 Transcript_6959/m.24372 type:complete len:184 (-) Transcript_6959:361-912(-)|eukprot:XP_005834490.1 hypothetical protein GUITHDRAFT_106497 [Guillardia theta CCMP2712]